MSRAVVAARVVHDVALMPGALEDEAPSGQRLQTVQVLDRLLALNAGNHRGGGRRGRHLALLHLLPSQQGATPPSFEHLPIGLAHRAFVARAERRIEHASDAIQTLDRSVDPNATDACRRLIDRHASLAIVQATENDIRPAIRSQAEVVDDIADKRRRFDARIDLFRASRRDFGFRTTDVRFAIQHGSRQVRVLDPIQVRDEDVADAEQCEVLDQLIANRAGPDDQHFRLGQALLIPPAD